MSLTREDFRSYQTWAATKVNQELVLTTRVVVAWAGLAGELGEIVDYLKKLAGHGHTLETVCKNGKTTQQNLVDEMGDLFWYINEMGTCLGSDIGFAAHTDYSLFRSLKSKHPDPALAHAIRCHKLVSSVGNAFLVTAEGRGMGYTADGQQSLRRLVHAYFELMYVLKFDMAEVIHVNRLKLDERYAEGFSTERSINRNV